MSCVLITGGLYIRSHTATLLSGDNKKFVIVDNFSNCNRDIIEKIKYICKKEVFYCNDIRDTKNLVKIIKENNVISVIHFAALKSVPDSIIKPLEYYKINV